MLLLLSSPILTVRDTSSKVIASAETILFRLTLLCYTVGMTAEETIASLEAQLKQALERLDEVTEQLRVAQARIGELEKLKTPPPAFGKAGKKKQAAEQKKARER